MPRQIAYVSTAARLKESDVALILETSQRNNAEAGIFGFLLYNQRNFLQVIEGEEPALQALMRRLAHDKRHSGMVVLEDVAIDSITFPTWHMERLSWMEDLEKRRSYLETTLPITLDGRIRQTVMNFASLR